MKQANDLGWDAVHFKDQIHVMPRNDIAHHRLFGCWCNPKYEEHRLALSPVYIHNAADKRANNPEWDRWTKAAEEAEAAETGGGALR